MSDAPGMGAVLQAFAREYGAAPRLDFRSPLPPELDPHPAKLVTAWAGPGYWHLVTCGLTELFEKFSDIPDQSGWGVELTMKVPRAEGDAGPPEYAVELLRFLVKYVYSSRKRFSRGHYIQLSPFEEGATRDPHLLTESTRPSVFEGPDAPPFPSEPAVAIGSLEVDVLRVSRSFTGNLEVEVDQGLSPQVTRLLGERLGQGHPLQLSAGSTRVRLRPGESAGWRQEEGLLTVELTPDAVKELSVGLEAAQANAPILLDALPGLTFRCVER